MEEKNVNFIPEREEKKSFGLKKLLVSLLLVAVIVTSFFLGYFVRYSSQSDANKLYNEIINIINYNVENADEENADEIARALIATLLSEDKYARYYTPAEYEDLKAQRDGVYEGIGVSFSQDGSISKVIWNSPAENSGVQVGDKILAGKLLAEDYVTFDSVEQIAEFLSNCENQSQITLKVERNSVELELNVLKEEYSVNYVKYYDSEKTLTFSGKELEPTVIEGGKASLDGKTAFIKLTQFEGEADVQIGKAMEYMKERGRTRLVLDLRDNGGGSIDTLKEIATYLICNNGKEYSRIAWINDGKRINDVIIKKNRYNANIEKISILANQNTASASEILIGAMLADANSGGAFKMDNLVLTYNTERGNFSTYGKGIMQTIYPLKNGGALKMTTAQLLWPDRVTCINGVGIAHSIEQNCFYDNNLAEERAIAIAKG